MPALVPRLKWRSKPLCLKLRITSYCNPTSYRCQSLQCTDEVLHSRDVGFSGGDSPCRLTPQFSGRALPCEARRERKSDLLFLYKKVLKTDLPYLDEIVRAMRPHRVPVVLTRTEAMRVLGCMEGRY